MYLASRLRGWDSSEHMPGVSWRQGPSALRAQSLSAVFHGVSPLGPSLQTPLIDLIDGVGRFRAGLGVACSLFEVVDEGLRSCVVAGHARVLDRWMGSGSVVRVV